MSSSKERISNALRAVKSKNTAPEICLRKALRAKGLCGYRLFWNKVIGKPDIAFPSKKIAIFVNGCFWHRCPYCKQKMPQSNVEFWYEKFERNKFRDQKIQKELAELGWNVIVIWECQIKRDVERCADIIKEAYEKALRLKNK